MKKLAITIVILCGLVLSLWVIGRITGTLQYYRVSTPANEPTLKVGEKIFTTNLKKAKLYQFIAFTSKYEDSVLAGIDKEIYKPGVHYLYRLCGEPGNIIEMKNAIFYVNGKNFDEDLNLKNQYKISVNQLNTIIEDEDKTDNTRQISGIGDSSLIELDETQLKKYQSKIKFALYIESDTSNGPFKWMNKNTIWTPDNFGPLIIPANCYFAMGDNRHNALDSRYTGFIKAADIKGVVLNK